MQLRGPLRYAYGQLAVEEDGVPKALLGVSVVGVGGARDRVQVHVLQGQRCGFAGG